MYTSLVMVALSSTLLPASGLDSVEWQRDYQQARSQGKKLNKPLAVFVGAGETGYEKVCRDSGLSPEAQKLLQDSYVCVYLDVGTEYGQKLAKDLTISRNLGMVLSDRTGELQAFSHDGDLSAAELTRWLQQFADPTVAVRTTMTNNGSRTSMYPPTANGNSAGYVMYGAYPGMYGTMNGGGVFFGGGGCPGGNCGGGIIRRW